MGNVTMMLEKGEKKARKASTSTTGDGKMPSTRVFGASKETKTMRVKGETKTCELTMHDPLRNAAKKKPVDVYKYHDNGMSALRTV